MDDERTTHVWVLDTSALIQLQDDYEADLAQLQSMLSYMENLLLHGQVCFPKQVVDELNRYHDDYVAGWSKRLHPIQAHADPSMDTVKEVLNQTPSVVDPHKEYVDADPYVIAHALQINAIGFTTCVVTEDRVQKPARIAMATACDMHGLDWMQTGQFLNHCGAVKTS